MKHTSTPHLMIRTVLLVTFGMTAALPSAGSGLTLCVCHDGHISFEVGCSPSYCCPVDVCTAAAEIRDATVELDGFDGGHPCIDIALLPGSVQRTVQKYYSVQNREYSVQVLAVVSHSILFAPSLGDDKLAVDSRSHCGPDLPNSTVVLIV